MTEAMSRAVMPSWMHFPPLPRGTTPLWAGVLGAPAAWAVQMEWIYAFATWCCWHHTRSLLYAANIGRWHITRIETDTTGRALSRAR